MPCRSSLTQHKPRTGPLSFALTTGVARYGITVIRTYHLRWEKCPHPISESLCILCILKCEMEGRLVSLAILLGRNQVDVHAPLPSDLAHRLVQALQCWALPSCS